MKRLAFLVYDSRSGSTLVAALLNRHAGISVSLESAFVSRLLDRRPTIHSPYDAVAVVDYLFEEVQFRELGMPRDELVSLCASLPRPATVRDIIIAVTQHYFSERDPHAAVWVVKHPPLSYVGALLSMFPDLLFVHVVRDGRAVFRSKRGSHSVGGRVMQRGLIQAAMSWRHVGRTVQRLGGRAIEVRYEDVVRETEDTIQRILDFLVIDPTGCRRTKSQTDYSAEIGATQRHLHVNVARPPNEEGTTRWMTELSLSDIDLFETINQPMFEAYGYALVGPGRRATPGRWLRRVGWIVPHLLLFAAYKVRNFILSVREGSAATKLRRRWLMRTTLRAAPNPAGAAGSPQPEAPVEKERACEEAER